MAVGADPQRGADVLELSMRPSGPNVLWRDPAARALTGPAQTFASGYPGGWQELFPTLGPATWYYGRHLEEHGEVAIRHWDYDVEESADHAAIAFEICCHSRRLLLRRVLSVTAGTAVLSVSETVLNQEHTDTLFMWGHHPVFGPPFLAPGCRLQLPPDAAVQPVRDQDGVFQAYGPATPWPEYHGWSDVREDLSVLPPPGPEHVDELYVSGMTTGEYSLVNPSLELGVRVQWDTAVFPNLWLWRTLGPDKSAESQYSLGLELFSSVPPEFSAAHCAGTLLRLGAGESMSTQLSVTLAQGWQPGPEEDS